MANSKDEQVSVRLPSDLRSKLERIAGEEDRTLSGTIRRIVAKALENEREGIAA
jgi:predicted transcriptional regulator